MWDVRPNCAGLNAKAVDERGKQYLTFSKIFKGLSDMYLHICLCIKKRLLSMSWCQYLSQNVGSFFEPLLDDWLFGEILAFEQGSQHLTLISDCIKNS